MLISVLMRLSSGHFMITDQQTVRRHWSGFGVFGGRREYPQASILGLVTKLWFDQGLDLAKYTIMPILIQNAKITESRISIFQIPKKKKKTEPSPLHLCHPLLSLLPLPFPFPEQWMGRRLILELLVTALVVLDIRHVFTTGQSAE